MSVNRANVIWIGKDGRWNIGFYDFYQTGDDYEWDVEYDYSCFHWASTGHASEDAARRAWDGANPGSSTIYDTYSPESDQFDKMVSELRAKLPSRRW